MDETISVTHTLGFPIDFNGNVSRVLAQAIQVARLGCDVDVMVSSQVPRENLKRAMDNGVRVHFMNALIPWGEIGWRINNVIPLFIETMKILGKNSKGILQIAAPTPVTKPLAASEVGRRLKRPMVLDLHDPWSADPFSSNLISMLQTQIMRRVINRADFIIVAHTALSKLVKRLNDNKPVEVIPNCVDTTLFGPKPRNLSIAKAIGLNEQNLVVAFCGHIEEDKGVDVLVRSAQIVHKRHKNVNFLVIGDGSYKRQVEFLVDKLGLRDVFRFIGFVPQELAAEYLSLADICVASYKPRAFFGVSLPETPLKVVEYLALAKPVVMSRISDENVVTWSGGGLMVRPGDVSELASNIIDLIEDAEFRKTMGEKGRKYVEANLSWTENAKRLMKIYQSLSAPD